ncbi:MAG TPA: hypothetical protein DDW23_01285 [Planctomycetes bacterium]|nr:hypothetical protein [Planctomycetota bacterium]
MTRPPSFLRKVRSHWRGRPGVVPWLTSRPVLLFLGGLRFLPASLASALAEAVGALVRFIPRRREIGLTNLEKALPTSTEVERWNLLKDSCRHMGLLAIDSVALLPRNQGQLLSRVDFEEGVREKLLSVKGQGAVLVQPHLGCFEGMTYILAEMGLEPAVPMRLPTNYYLAEHLKRAREKWGVCLVPRRGGVRKLLSHQREGGAVCLASDQNSHRSPTFLPWFGELAATDRTAPGLALGSKSPLLVCWCIRTTESDRFQVGCEILLETGSSREKNREAEENLGLQIHATLESAILNCPSQYLWVHDRYRTRPAEFAQKKS